MKRKSERGAIIVEFAMIFPLLVLLLIGIIDMSLILYNKAVLTNASREGCRAGIVAQDRTNTSLIDAHIQAVVSNYCQNHLVSFSSNTPLTTVTWPSPVSFGNPLEVTVTYNHGFLALPNMSSFTNPFNLSAETEMLLE
jgi:Flp pilus assembly protein TadG